MEEPLDWKDVEKLRREAKWVVTTDANYYPTVFYFRTKEDAQAYAASQQWYPRSSHDSVCVCEIHQIEPMGD